MQTLSTIFTPRQPRADPVHDAVTQRGCIALNHSLRSYCMLQDKYVGYVVGVIVSSEQASPKDKKYKALMVDIGAGEPVPIVTVAKHADEGDRVVSKSSHPS
jgi:tRNA-binding EMAP/Myf-like protein